MRTTDACNTLVSLESVLYERKKVEGGTITFDSGYSFLYKNLWNCL